MRVFLWILFVVGILINVIAIVINTLTIFEVGLRFVILIMSIVTVFGRDRSDSMLSHKWLKLMLIAATAVPIFLATQNIWLTVVNISIMVTSYLAVVLAKFYYEERRELSERVI